MSIVAYTDGSAVPNPGIGGWGWHCTSTVDGSNVVFEDCGGKLLTTNNEMELMAIAEFLDFCPPGKKVDVYTDSQYVMKIFVDCSKSHASTRNMIDPVSCRHSGWIKGWVRPKMQSKLFDEIPQGYWAKSIKNDELVFRIYQSILRHFSLGTNVCIGWVRGHSGIEGNEIADNLASQFYETHSRGIV